MELEATMVAAVRTLAAGADRADEGTTGEIARRLDLAEQLKMVAQQIIDVTSESLGDRMEEPTLVVAGVGLFHRKASKRTVWRDGKVSSERFRADVFSSVRSRALDTVNALDHTTGEINPAVQGAVRAATELLDESLPSFSGLLQKGWRTLDLDETDYRRIEWSNRIQIDRGVEVSEP